MRIFLNELSLDRGFHDGATLRAAFLELMKVRARSPSVARTLRTSHSLMGLTAVGDEQIIATLGALGRDEKAQIFTWLQQRGPFLETDRQHEENDLFWFEDTDVTDLGLGEASRQLVRKQSAAVFSIIGPARKKFETSPLRVTHGLVEEPISLIDVINIFRLDELVRCAENAEPEPQSWPDLLRVCGEKFDKLHIVDCRNILAPHPFHPNAARQAIELLAILNEIMSHLNNDSSLNEEGERLRQEYFVRQDWFSDEGDRNKQNFLNEMTFDDPREADARITCFWHGKINTPKFRIHFEWPAKKGRRMLIPYIGPKISKT